MHPKFIPNGTAFHRFQTKYTVAASGCHEWNGWDKSRGYPSFALNGREGNVGAHVAAYILSGRRYVEGAHVAHSCDNHRCVNQEHLFLTTNKGNLHDCIAKGRHPTVGVPGSQRSTAKLTEEIVREIRASTQLQEHLAKKFNVSRSLICRVQSRKCWTHI